MLQEYGALDFPCAERGKMGRVLLAVDEWNPLATTHTDQSRQGDFGSIGCQGEHGFTENSTTHANAVQATHESAPYPGFDGVGVACCM